MLTRKGLHHLADISGQNRKAERKTIIILYENHAGTVVE